MHLLGKRRPTWIIAPIVGLALLAVGVPAIGRAISGTLTVSTTSLSNGEVGSAYSQTLAATGGTSPYTWAVTAGTLPAGLSLDTTTGVISGTPTAVGTSNFTAQVTDSAAVTATADLSITVNAAVSITTTSLPAGEVGSAYAQTLAASGGITPYAWSLSVGALPAGLSLNASTGVISGTPTAVGTVAFTVMVTDSVARTATMPLSIAVSDNLAVATVSLANGSTGVAYSQTLTASGGVAPFTWSLAVGTLPAGLSLNGATGVISGTPTATGTSDFTVMVTDNLARSAVKALAITVNSGLTVETTSLPGGTVGTAYSQTLTAVGGTSPYIWSISVGSLPAGLSLNASTGLISGTPTTVQTASFTAMVTDAASHTASQALSIAIGAAGTPPPPPSAFPELRELTERVDAACQPAAIALLDASEQSVQAALCDFFSASSQLSPSIRNAVGHLILKIAGVMAKGASNHEDESTPDASQSGNAGDHHHDADIDDSKGDRHSFATITLTSNVGASHAKVTSASDGRGRGSNVNTSSWSR